MNAPVAPVTTMLRNRKRADRLLLDLMSDKRGLGILPRKTLDACLDLINEALNESAADAATETRAAPFPDRHRRART